MVAAAQGEWDEIPARYGGTLRAHGRICHLVSFVQGEVVEVMHAEEIEAMESVEAFECTVGVGSVISPTIDISATDAGQVRMVHEDEAVIERDFQRIVELMETMFVVK